MSGKLATVQDQQTSLIATFGNRYGVNENKVLQTLKATAFKQSGGKDVSNEQMISLLVVANEYNLNPFTKEIYAFSSNGGITPIVSIDGWMKIVNAHPDMDGMEFSDNIVDNKLVSITCSIFRKGRSHPTTVTEYLEECKKSTDPWKKWPARMLRHKAAIQCARYAFSLSGISDPDEADRIQESIKVVDDESVVIDCVDVETANYPEQKFNDNYPAWKAAIESGKLTPGAIIAKLETIGPITDGQRKSIHSIEARS